MAVYLYTSVRDEDKIVKFTIDINKGLLEDRKEVVIAGGPGPMTMDPLKKHLFAGLRKSYEIAGFQVDKRNGEISLTAKASLESDPCFLGTDHKGKFLFSTYYNAGRIGVHALGGEKLISRQPVQWIATEPKAHSIRVDPSNRFVFSPHTGPNKIYRYCFNDETGELTPHNIPWYSPETPAEPRHSCFHTRLPLLYVINEAGSSVSVFNFDSTDGNLSHIETVSTLPANHLPGNTCAEIRIDPSGRFLYASNRGHDSIACFIVNTVTGRLNITGHVPTEKTPRSFDLSPDGRFLYAAGQDSGCLSMYMVRPEDGTLEQIGRCTLGKCPIWVMAVGMD